MTSSIRREAEAFSDKLAIFIMRRLAMQEPVSDEVHKQFGDEMEGMIEAFAKAQRIAEVEAIERLRTMLDERDFIMWLAQRKKELEP